MQINKYGIELKRLTLDEIEFIRVKRNSENVNRYMHYREHITPEMQVKWFNSIDNVYHYYFIINYKGEKVGLISGRIERGENTELITEGGIFIWDLAIRNTYVPIASALIMCDFNFILGMSKIKVKILKENQRAILFNKSLGFEATGEATDEVIWLSLTLENYNKSIEKLRYGLGILTSDFSKLNKTEIILSKEFESIINQTLASESNSKNQVGFLSKLVKDQ